MAEFIGDYSEYQKTNAEQYESARSDYKTLKFHFYHNKVLYDRDDHEISIKVDPTKEYYSVHDEIEQEVMRRAKKSGRSPLHEYLGDTEETEEIRQEYLKYNEEVLKKLTEKYQIYPGDYYAELFYKDHPEVPFQPLINVFSGQVVNLRLGEGILDYIYADFESHYEKTLAGAYIFLELDRAAKRYRKSEGLPEPVRSVTKYYNQGQVLSDQFFEYNSTFHNISDLVYSSLYSAICPPLIVNSESLNGFEEKAYAEYLMELQKEYRELIEFCYDEDFYPDLLGELLPSERYAVYRYIHGLHSRTERTERFEVNRYLSLGTKMPYGMEEEQKKERFIRYLHKGDEEFKAFAERYHLKTMDARVLLARPSYIVISYQVSSVADMLELEFTKMLEENIRFRKCKRCGRYFIMKGNYNTNFCDRIDPETGKTCKELGAIDNFKKKMADNAAIPLYQKYYKRYAARVKVKQIKEKDFKKWKYEAVSKRDDCCEGKISVEEYEEWLEGSFPNRKKK